MDTSLSNREKKILQILMEDSRSSVTEMSKALGVSAVTLRSDLRDLADKGMIVRTRGGAFPAFHPNILDQWKNRTEEKARIARAAANLIEDGDNIMIVAGTTTAQIAKYLMGKRDIHIVTNSTLLLPYARINPALTVTLVGGEFRASGEALVGPNAIRSLDVFHVKTAFLGTDGFSLESGCITAHIVEIAEVVEKMAAQAERSVLLADSSKCGKMGFASIMPLHSISLLITDRNLPREAQEALAGSGPEVLMV